MDKRFFTVQEANELLPFLTRRMQHLQLMRRSLARRAAQTLPTLQEIILAGGKAVCPTYFEQIQSVSTLLAEIGSHGCHLKDLESGLIDFPTIWEGREVYLCWKLGEPEVAFWHDLHTGFAGRQPLKTSPRA